MRRTQLVSPGYTLVELLVVIGILAVLISLLLPAVQQVRATALHMQSANNLRQLSLAAHQFSTAHGQFPDAEEGTPVGDGHIRSPHVVLTQYIEQEAVFWKMYGSANAGVGGDSIIRTFYNPTDPTLTSSSLNNFTSYALNLWVCRKGIGPDRGISDGTSNTLAWSERYAYNCGGDGVFWTETSGRTRFPVPLEFCKGCAPITAFRSPTFADSHMTPMDHFQYPPLFPTPSVTFQVRPKVADCDPRQVQASQSRGLLVALADGSVRTLAPGISPATFWAAVTPDGGEVLGGDW